MVIPFADLSAEKQAEYKLQAADLTTQGSAADTVSADTVSYTHLDVYKRQVMVSSASSEESAGCSGWSRALSLSLIHI